MPEHMWEPLPQTETHEKSVEIQDMSAIELAEFAEIMIGTDRLRAIILKELASPKKQVTSVVQNDLKWLQGSISEI